MPKDDAEFLRPKGLPSCKYTREQTFYAFPGTTQSRKPCKYCLPYLLGIAAEHPNSLLVKT